MPCPSPAAVVVLALCAAAIATPSTAGGSGGAASPSPDQGWTVLFDGTSTAAWRGYNRDSFPADSWSVEGGLLRPLVAASATDLMTREEYRDFDLELDWKLAAKGNSGILYRVAELPPPEPSWHSGPEMQILDDDAYRGNPPSTWTGALYDLIEPKDKLVHPLGEWNHARVVVQGRHVEHWLNGRRLLAYELGSPELQALIAKSKFKDLPRFARETAGHIVLQHHGGGVWFRDVKVRRPGAAR